MHYTTNKKTWHVMFSNQQKIGEWATPFSSHSHTRSQECMHVATTNVHCIHRPVQACMHVATRARHDDASLHRYCVPVSIIWLRWTDHLPLAGLVGLGLRKPPCMLIYMISLDSVQQQTTTSTYIDNGKANAVASQQYVEWPYTYISPDVQYIRCTFALACSWCT